MNSSSISICVGASSVTFCVFDIKGIVDSIYFLGIVVFNSSLIVVVCIFIGCLGVVVLISYCCCTYLYWFFRNSSADMTCWWI